MERPLVSFIIPVRDQMEKTRDCLLSLLGTLPEIPYEVILVNDASGQETRDFLQSIQHPHFKIISNSNTKGFAFNNNIAAEYAHGEYLALINNDLILTSHWLEPMLRAFNILPDVGVIGNVQYSAITGGLDHVGKFWDANGLAHHYGQHLLPHLHQFPPQDYIEFPIITAACWLVKRGFFLENDGFDESYLNGYEDDDFCMRTSEKGFKHYVALQSRIFHYVSSSDTRKIKENENEKIFKHRWHKHCLKWHSENFDNYSGYFEWLLENDHLEKEELRFKEVYKHV